jgi:transcriptional regulator of acetoin/glycerol metabolism
MEDTMIYFIQAGNDGPIKIGWTTNGIKERLANLQTSSPYPLKLLGVMEGELKDELQLHRMFSEYLVTGEWYSSNKDLLNFIASATNPESDVFRLKDAIKQIKLTNQTRLLNKNTIHLRDTLQQIEIELIIEALRVTNGKQSDAAKLLSITRSGLCQKIQKLNIVYK